MTAPNSSQNQAQPTRSRLQASDIPPAISSFISVVVVLGYPIGFLTFWAQLHMTYGYDQKTALYATHLLPTAIVAGKFVSGLAWAPFALIPMFIVAVFVMFVEDIMPGCGFSLIGQVLWIGIGIGFYFVQSKTSETFAEHRLVAITLSILFAFFVGFGAFAWGGGFFRFSPGGEGFITFPNGDVTWSWSRMFLSTATANLALILAAMCIVAGRPLALPTAEFRLEDRSVKTINLLSNSDGAWYGIRIDANHTMVAIPSQRVEEVKIRQ
jgi:hypothetical protein